MWLVHFDFILVLILKAAVQINYSTITIGTSDLIFRKEYLYLHETQVTKIIIQCFIDQVEHSDSVDNHASTKSC
uniref:Putative ovule protein n=1 Tax=Solanum chacoense TaxID=4108 RepID=A0A0V0H1J1_SOLCH